MIVLQVIGAIIVFWLTFGALCMAAGVATVELSEPLDVAFPKVRDRLMFILWLCVLIPLLVLQATIRNRK
jgi:hypothetical protein